jgi:hypothetical protein
VPIALALGRERIPDLLADSRRWTLPWDTDAEAIIDRLDSLRVCKGGVRGTGSKNSFAFDALVAST